MKAHFRVLISVLGLVVAGAVTAPAVSAPPVAAAASSAAAVVAPAVAGAVVAVTPSRIADSRLGLQIPGPVPAQGTAVVPVTGRGGIPRQGAAAVIATVTVDGPQSGGYVTVWPSGTGMPGTSNLNFLAGRTIASTVVVRLDSDGKIQLFNGSPGTVQLIVDVTGYVRSGTRGLGLTLRRPHPEVQRITRELAAKAQPVPAADTMTRNGSPVPGQTAPDVVSNLIWRTFGHARAGRAESVLDWAGLFGGPAGPVARVAARHRVAPATLTSRARQVARRGAQTPLSPLLLRDATRATQPTEDHLGRQRTAQLLGLPPPPSR